MTVYVIMDHVEYEGSWIHRIYAKLEEAEKEMDRLGRQITRIRKYNDRGDYDKPCPKCYVSGSPRLVPWKVL